MMKQKNGRYQRSVKIGVDENRKSIRKFFTATTKKEVDALVAAYKQEQAALSQVLSESAIKDDIKTTTFADMAEIWLTEYKRQISDGVQRRYKSVLTNHLNPEIGNIPLTDLKPLHLRTLLNRLVDSDYSTKTIAEIKQTASQVMEAAVENDLARRNVFAKVKIQGAESEVRDVVDEAIPPLILSTCEKHRMGIPALIMLYMGIRKGELIALKWENVDLVSERLTVNKAACFHNNSVSIKTPKTKSGFRTIPITKHIIPILERAKTSAASEYV